MGSLALAWARRTLAAPLDPGRGGARLRQTTADRTGVASGTPIAVVTGAPPVAHAALDTAVCARSIRRMAESTGADPQALPHVVILGGGFAGLTAARTLRRTPVRITIVDRRNHHLFQPLLYQVATAALNPGDIAYPIRSVLRRQQNARTILARADRIDPAGRR